MSLTLVVSPYLHAVSLMADVFSKRMRSEVMSRIRSKNTRPERLVRSALHRRGFRFRVHVRALPGKPDIVLQRYSTVVQVRGCFWHRHDCRDGKMPKTSRNYWKPKLEQNVVRDQRNDRRLRSAGWHVITVWECRLSSRAKIETEMRRVTRLLKCALQRSVS